MRLIYTASLLRFVKLFLGLLAARAAPVGRQVLERDAVMFGGVIDITADGADVLTCRRLEHDFAGRNDGRWIGEINDPVLFQTFQRLRRVGAEPDGRTRRAECATAVQRFAGGGLVVIDHGLNFMNHTKIPTERGEHERRSIISQP